MTPWIAEGRRNIGVREVKGAGTSLVIKGWLSALRAWWSDDETPWCGVFAAHCMRSAGLAVPRHWYRAKAWAAWGTAVVPCAGCVVVYERAGGGHVGFLVGVDRSGRHVVLGGNQGDAVKLSALDPRRCVATRWPANFPLPTHPALPVLAAGAPASTNEA